MTNAGITHKLRLAYPDFYPSPFQVINSSSDFDGDDDKPTYFGRRVRQLITGLAILLGMYYEVDSILY